MMKPPILKFILLLCFGLCAKLNFGYCQTPIFNSVTVSNLTANGTQAKRYKIAEVGYNSYHWQDGGIIQVELFHKYFGVGYDKYYVEIGYSQGTGTTLPVLRHVEGTGFYHTAKVSLGIPEGMGINYSGYPNMILPIYVDVRYYSNYIAKITFIRNRVTTFDGLNQIKINETPQVEDITDFEVPIGAKSLYISESGNVGIGTQSPWTKIDIIGRIGIRAADGGYRSEIFNENSSSPTAQAFSFLNAGGQNLLSLNYNGNVGIGTSTPTSKLDVRGNLFVGESVDGGGFTIRNLQSNIFKNDFLIVGKTNYTYLGNYQNFPLGIYTNNTERIRVSENGNVGIGNSNPIAKLDVNGITTFGIRYMRTDAQDARISIGDNSGKVWSWATGWSGGTVGDFSLIEEGISGNRIYVQKVTGNVGINTSTPKNTLDVNGNVGIGLGTAIFPADYKLAVAGNVIAEKVKVKKSNTWPDFVFSPSYKLPSLTEVESFVKQNSHLPEIPSAAEIEKDGQDLGEMNRLLLKKVEELTLYLIEQNKNHETQNRRIESQNNIIDLMQKEINYLKSKVK